MFTYYFLRDALAPVLRPVKFRDATATVPLGYTVLATSVDALLEAARHTGMQKGTMICEADSVDRLRDGLGSSQHNHAVEGCAYLPIDWLYLPLNNRAYVNPPRTRYASITEREDGFLVEAINGQILLNDIELPGAKFRIEAGKHERSVHVSRFSLDPAGRPIILPEQWSLSALEKRGDNYEGPVGVQEAVPGGYLVPLERRKSGRIYLQPHWLEGKAVVDRSHVDPDGTPGSHDRYLFSKLSVDFTAVKPKTGQRIVRVRRKDGFV